MKVHAASIGIGARLSIGTNPYGQATSRRHHRCMNQPTPKHTGDEPASFGDVARVVTAAELKRRQVLAVADAIDTYADPPAHMRRWAAQLLRELVS